MGLGPPRLSRDGVKDPAKDYSGAQGLHGSNRTGRQRGAAEALQARLDVEPVLFVGGVHRHGPSVCRKGSFIKISTTLHFKHDNKLCLWVLSRKRNVRIGVTTPLDCSVSPTALKEREKKPTCDAFTRNGI